MAEDLSPDLQKMMTDGVKQMAQEIEKTIEAHIKAGKPMPLDQLAGDMRAARDLADAGGLDFSRFTPTVTVGSQTTAAQLEKLGIKASVVGGGSKPRASSTPPFIAPSNLSGIKADTIQPTPSAFLGPIPSTAGEAKRMSFTELKALHKDLFGKAYKGKTKGPLVEKVVAELGLSPTLPTPGSVGNAAFFAPRQRTTPRPKPSRTPTPRQEKKMAKGALGALNMDQLRAMHVEEFGKAPARNIGRKKLEAKLSAAICATSSPVTGVVASAEHAIIKAADDAAAAISKVGDFGFSVLPDTPIFSRGFRPENFSQLSKLNKSELATLIKDVAGRKPPKTTKRETMVKRAAKLLNIEVPRGAGLGARSNVSIRQRTQAPRDIGPLPLGSVRDFLPASPTHKDLLALPMRSLQQLHLEVLGKTTKAKKKSSIVPKLHKALGISEAPTTTPKPKARQVKVTPGRFDSLDPFGARVAQGRAPVATPTSYDGLAGLNVPQLRSLHERLMARKSKHRTKAKLVAALAKALGLKKPRGRKATHCRFEAPISVGLTRAQKAALDRQTEKGRRSAAVRDALEDDFKGMGLPDDC